MKKALYAYVFIAVNIFVKINGMDFDMIPDFAGYMILGSALIDYQNLSDNIKKVKNYSVLMVFYTGFMFMQEAVLSLYPEIVTGFLTSSSLILTVYITHMFVMGIKDIETVKKVDLNASKLITNFKIFAVSSCAVAIVRFLKFIPVVNEYKSIIEVLGVIGGILFVLSVNKMTINFKKYIR